jgi:hypothetical protein
MRPHNVADLKTRNRFAQDIATYAEARRKRLLNWQSILPPRKNAHINREASDSRV